LIFYEKFIQSDCQFNIKYKGNGQAFETITKTIKSKRLRIDCYVFFLRSQFTGPILNGIADQISGDEPCYEMDYTRGREIKT